MERILEFLVLLSELKLLINSSRSVIPELQFKNYIH